MIATKQVRPVKRVAVSSRGLPRARLVANPRCITHARLDKCLERLARRPERFTLDALRLSAALDARAFDSEITDPQQWRGTMSLERVTVENQFGAETECMRILGREEELRLALRIEFAKIRLDRALERHGRTAKDLAVASALPPELRRRKAEWHALRLEMFERNLYLVSINVERYRHTSADRSDLMQAAAASLFRAIDGFDWRRGVLFRTYAVHWLRQGFRSYLYNSNSTIRVPVYLQKSTKHINAAVERLGDPHASIDEIAQESGLRRSVVASARTAARRTRSLDAPLDRHDGTRTLASELAIKNDEGPYSLALEDVSVASGVEAALGKLSERERRVVEMRFGIGYDRGHIYAEVAEELGVSLERVRQILVRAVSKMRTPRLLRMIEPLLT